jgi:hypothetical protein
MNSTPSGSQKRDVGQPAPDRGRALAESTGNSRVTPMAPAGVTAPRWQAGAVDREGLVAVAPPVEGGRGTVRTRKSRWRLPCQVVALAGVTALAACSSTPGSADPRSEPSVGTIPRLITTETLQLPLDQFLQSPENMSKVQAAYRVRLRQCVADFGLDLTLPTPTTRQQPGPNARRYGVTDPDAVAVYGYRPPPGTTTRKQASHLPTDVQNVLSGRGQTTINGRPVPSGGCIAKANADLAGGRAPIDDSLAMRLGAESLARSQADSRVRAVLGRWSACMKRLGFDYSTPANAIADPRFTSGDAASRTEIATATADVTCKQQANLVGVWSAVEAAYQQRSITQNQAALDAIRKAHEDQLRHAAQVLSAP